MKVFIENELVIEKQNLQTNSMELLNYYAEEGKVYEMTVMLWKDSLF